MTSLDPGSGSAHHRAESQPWDRLTEELVLGKVGRRNAWDVWKL